MTCSKSGAPSWFLGLNSSGNEKLTGLEMEAEESEKVTRGLRFIGRYITGYDDADDAYVAIPVQRLFKHALDKKNPKERRALAAIDIWTAVHFCLGVESYYGEQCVRVLREIWRSAKRIALCKLLETRMDDIGSEYTSTLQGRREYLSQLIKDSAACHLIFHLLGDMDHLLGEGGQLSSIELDLAFEESKKRLKTIWSYVDIVLRLPLSRPSEFSSTHLPAIGAVQDVLQILKEKKLLKKFGYRNNILDKAILSNTIARSRPVFPLVYAIYGLGCYGRRTVRFSDENFCKNLINFTTQPERLPQIAQFYADLSARLPDSLPIEFPESVIPKQVPLTPLNSRIESYF